SGPAGPPGCAGRSPGAGSLPGRRIPVRVRAPPQSTWGQSVVARSGNIPDLAIGLQIVRQRSAWLGKSLMFREETRAGGKMPAPPRAGRETAALTPVNALRYSWG